MKVVGLTGLPASGKTTIVNHLRDKGAPVFVADECVHKLLKEPAVIAEVQKQFPEAIVQGTVDRQKLGAAVFRNDAKLSALEKILHPRVRTAEENWIKSNRPLGKKAVVLEIPLLIETNAHDFCDVVWVVAAADAVIKKRLQDRGWSPVRIEAALKRFISHEKRALHADAIILSDVPQDKMLAQVDELVKKLSA